MGDSLVQSIEWRVEDGLVDYARAVATMERRVGEIRAGQAPELVWLVEHPPLYTAGASARHEDLIDPGDLPVIPTGRGGQYTYHGPGQRVAYVLLDLRARGQDVRRFVRGLEDWIVAALGQFDIAARGRPDRIGVWVDRSRDRGPGHEDKIAAIGVRVRRWVTYHGVAVNVAPDLSRFQGIVPCGVADPRFGVTSIAALGHAVSMAEVDSALRSAFPRAVD